MSNHKKLVEDCAKLFEDTGVQAISLDVPAFIRALEYAREEIKSDDDLHIFVEKLLTAQSDSGTIDMSSLKQIIG